MSGKKKEVDTWVGVALPPEETFKWDGDVESKDAVQGLDAFDSKLGGQPQWLVKDKNATVPTCSVCGRNMYLVCQAYAPLSCFDRTVYIFACNATACQEKPGTWAAIRSQKFNAALDEEDDIVTAGLNVLNGIASASSSSSAPSQPEKPKEIIKPVFEVSDDWGDDDGAVSSSAPAAVEQKPVPEAPEKQEKEEEEAEAEIEDDDEEDEQPEITQEEMDEMIKFHQEKMEKLKLEEKQSASSSSRGKKSKGKSRDRELLTASSPNTFPELELDIFLEPAASHKDEKNMQKELDLLAQYKMNESQLKADGVDQDFPDDMPENGDEVFLKFSKRFGRVPNQAIRWSFGGEPLWMSTQKPKSIPNCELCGARRLPEFQVLSTIIFSLQAERFCPANDKVEGKPLTRGLDFGTAIVYTCSGLCCADREKGQTNREYIFVESAV